MEPGKDPPAPVAADAEQVTTEPARSNPAVEQSAPVSVPSEGRIERVRAAVERWVAQLVGSHRPQPAAVLSKAQAGIARADGCFGDDADVSAGWSYHQTVPTSPRYRGTNPIEQTKRSLTHERSTERLAAFSKSAASKRSTSLLGIASWVTDATLATPASPLLMAPIRLKPVGSGETDYSVQVTGDWRINDTLLLYLAETYDTTIDASAILDVFDPSSRDRTEVYDRFRKETAQVPSITVRDRIGIGTFQYTKLPMVRDLVENVEELAANELVAAIAGDESAREALREMRTDIDPAFPNEIAPADEFLVLDADSSQNYTITAVVGGESIVIQGPPGTGKSQTIVNLIATLTARGRKVLFVAEKRAAIDAVTKRLRMVGLGDIVLDLHGGISSRRDLAAALATSLDRIKSVVAANDLDRDFRLVQNRKALLECSDSLHRVRDPFSVSVYDAYVGLAGLPDDLRLPVRLPSSQLNDLDAISAREARLALSEWAQLTAPLRDRSTAWVDTAITSADQASRAMEAAIAVSSVATTTATELATVLVETGLPAPATLEGWVRVFEVLGAIAALQEIADKSILRLSDDELSPLNAAMQPGLGSVVHRAWARFFDGPYRDAISTLREYWIGTKSASGARLADLVVRVMSVRAGWDEVRGSSEIRLPTALSTSETSAAELERRLAALGAFFVTRPESHLSHSDVGAWSSRLVAEQDILYRLPRVAELEQQLTASHLRPIVDAVANGEIRGEDVAAGFDYVWYSSIIAAATAVDPVLASFEGGLQTRRVEAFRNDDSEHVLTTPQRVERAIAMRAVEARNQHPGQDELIHAQARRKRGHLSLRELFRHC